MQRFEEAPGLEVMTEAEARDVIKLHVEGAGTPDGVSVRDLAEALHVSPDQVQTLLAQVRTAGQPSLVESQTKQMKRRKWRDITLAAIISLLFLALLAAGPVMESLRPVNDGYWIQMGGRSADIRAHVDPVRVGHVSEVADLLMIKADELSQPFKEPPDAGSMSDREKIRQLEARNWHIPGIREVSFTVFAVNGGPRVTSVMPVYAGKNKEIKDTVDVLRKEMMVEALIELSRQAKLQAKVGG